MEEKLNLKTENLPCSLTDAEIRDRGVQLAALIEEIAQAEAGRKAANDASKERISELQEDVALLARQVHTGQEVREVEVYESKDFATAQMQVIRADTLEIVRSRKMTPSELQRELPMRERAAEDDEDETTT